MPRDGVSLLSVQPSVLIRAGGRSRSLAPSTKMHTTIVLPNPIRRPPVFPTFSVGERHFVNNRHGDDDSLPSSSRFWAIDHSHLAFCFFILVLKWNWMLQDIHEALDQKGIMGAGRSTGTPHCHCRETGGDKDTRRRLDNDGPAPWSQEGQHIHASGWKMLYLSRKTVQQIVNETCDVEANNVISGVDPRLRGRVQCDCPGKLPVPVQRGC